MPPASSFENINVSPSSSTNSTKRPRESNDVESKSKRQNQTMDLRGSYQQPEYIQEEKQISGVRYKLLRGIYYPENNLKGQEFLYMPVRKID